MSDSLDVEIFKAIEPAIFNAGDKHYLDQAIARVKALIQVERNRGASEKPQPQEEVGGKQVDTLSLKKWSVVEAIENMGSINEPYELFEPYIYKDKLGDSMWHCEIRTTHSVLWHGEGGGVHEAVYNCEQEVAGKSDRITALRGADLGGLERPSDEK